MKFPAFPKFAEFISPSFSDQWPPWFRTTMQEWWLEIANHCSLNFDIGMDFLSIVSTHPKILIVNLFPLKRGPQEIEV